MTVTNDSPNDIAPEPPQMGTSLWALLQLYVGDLQAYSEHSGDRITRQMIDCGVFLLTEGERLRGEARLP